MRGGRRRAPRNPQNVLDTAPQGTRDWKRVLHCVLVIHNQEHSGSSRPSPQKTMLDRESASLQVLGRPALQHHVFREADPRILMNRQVQAVAAVC